MSLFFNDTATTEIYTLSLHDALPISGGQEAAGQPGDRPAAGAARAARDRSEEHTSELQSRQYLVCRLLLEKKKQITRRQANVESQPCSQGPARNREDSDR